MAFTLPELPYTKDALTPHLSAETLEYHYGKHHKAYVDKLNELSKGTEWETKSLEEIVKRAEGGIFNNGAQAWNHSFYWRCLKPRAGGQPSGPLAQAIDKAFGSFDQFRQQFTQAAVTLFGSGWTWLAKDSTGRLSIQALSNAGNPLRDGKTPLLTCDVWEHAYYIDYRNARAKYVEAFWQLVDWDFVAQSFSR